MTCSTCNEARAAPEYSRLFAQGCLYCAARRIQYLQRVLFKGDKKHIVDKRQERCRKALADAVADGLNGPQVRELARKAAWQLAPIESSPARPKSGG